ncbi:MAG TPA: efflux RND transporter permease subunit [Candidatus Brocadiia bacterium]|nr:efflux RND transporter permease subunit [Candidatus Brocadiia bacterium]
MTELPLEKENKGAVAWMARHSVAANLAMLLCLVGGFIALRNTKQEVFPDITFDAVTVQVAYPGATPEDAENGILLAVEEAVQGLDGVDEVTATASEGGGVVTVEMLLGADLQKLANEIQNEVDRITTFPEDAEEPEIRIVQNKREVLTVVLYGDAPDTVLHRLGEQARDQLLQDPGITQVDLSGLPSLEIGIEISQENLRRYGLTIEEIARRLGNASVDLPGGGLKTETGEVLVRVKERRDYGKQFAELPIITTPDGAQVRLGDVARIDDSFADTDRFTQFNGHRAITLDVYRVGDQTPVSVSDAVKRQLAEIESDLPPGIDIAIRDDRSDTYKQRVELLLKNGAMGLALVMISLGLFLEARLAFWVMMGIPVSFLGAFLFLPHVDITINMMSLFAFIIALGIVVDDAIVVGENVYTYHQSGVPFLRAAIIGTQEVASPVVFSVLTNIVTFIPIYFIPGTMGKIFKMVPVVVCMVFAISLLECLYVLPAHLGHHRERRRRGIKKWLHERQQAFSKWFMRQVQDRYGPALAFTMRHRYVTVAAALTFLVLCLSYALSGRMGLELFPIVESDFADARLVLPYGAPVEKTEAAMKRIVAGAEKIIEESGHPELVKSILAEVGNGGGHMCRVRVELAEAEVRDKIMSTLEFTNRWRQKVGEIPGVEYLRFASDAGGPGGGSRPVTVELSHRSIEVLEQASADLAETLATYPKVKDVDDGFQPGKQQLDFTIKPEGKALGLTARDVARQVRSAFYGAEVLRQQRGRNEVKIIVRLPETERSTEHTIESLLIRAPAGAFVPLKEVADVSRGRAYTTINRRNGRRVVQVSADIVPRSQAGEVLADLKVGALPELIRKYPGLMYSFEGHEADMRESMGSLKITSILAVMGVFVLLAIPFRSYSQPLIIMVSIPFGVVGAIMGHLVMGYNLSIPSLFGIVALSGVVINDSLVMIEFANNRLRQDGLSPWDAIHSAAIQRFRPIMLTTLTTFGGLAPMIFERSRQARFLIPMALSLGYGLLFATLITLVLAPSLFMLVADAKRASAAVGRAMSRSED